LFFLLLIAGLFFSYRQDWSLSKKVLIGMIVGIIYGLGLKAIYSDSAIIEQSVVWFNLIGNGYVQLLQMVIMPLIFISILSVVKLHQTTSLGKISVFVIGILLVTTAIAAFVGISITNLFGLTAEGLVQGTKETARLAAIQSDYIGQVTNLDIPKFSLYYHKTLLLI
jgi:L-cystine uptake protein TcyP (sodium:dicarboxylate symporter family)